MRKKLRSLKRWVLTAAAMAVGVACAPGCALFGGAPQSVQDMKAQLTETWQACSDAQKMQALAYWREGLSLVAEGKHTEAQERFMCALAVAGRCE